MLVGNNIESYIINLYQNKHIPLPQNVEESYGEILFPSVEKIFKSIFYNTEDIFVDFGSGLGKLCLQVLFTKKLKKIIGLEINSLLYEQSTTVTNKIRTDFPNFDSLNRLEFHCIDFRKFNLNEATIALLGSPCYTQKTFDILGQRFNLSNIHTVASLKPIRTLNRLRFRKIINLECSWDSALCYIYSSFR